MRSFCRKQFLRSSCYQQSGLEKIEFNSMLSSYIADIGYADAFEAYSRENITSFESEWQAQVPGKSTPCGQILPGLRI